MNENSFIHERVRTWPCFETEAKGTRNWLVFVHPELDWGNMLVGMQERSIHDIFVSKTQDVRRLTKQVTTLSDLARLRYSTITSGRNLRLARHDIQGSLLRDIKIE